MSGKPLWRPNPDYAATTAMAGFHRLMSEENGGNLESYADLHRWSVNNPDRFWTRWLEESGIVSEGPTEPARGGEAMPTAPYFPEVQLSFAENLLRFARGTPERDATPDAVALVSVSESRPRREVTYGQLLEGVTGFAARLQELGIQQGDRVAGFIPNIDEAVVAMLGASSLGAIWSSSSPDFGVQGVLDRFGQIEPRVLVVADGYRYGGKTFDSLEKVREICSAIPSIEHVVVIPYLEGAPEPKLDFGEKKAWTWPEFVSASGSELPLPRLPFNHPLYIMYSSGTTGVPKCIVHGAGGTLLQHAKELVLHSDLRAGDRILYFTTCGWMMWNWLVSSLFTGATVVLYDGSPSFPGVSRLWELVAEERVTHFGTSPKFVGACRGQYEPGKTVDLSGLRVLFSTGAPLLPEDFDWIYGEVKADLQIASICGGTDIISCFMLGSPTLPVYRGEIQCLGLGMDVAAYDDSDQPVTGTKGELVCRTPFPSAPIEFWRDPDRARYTKAYFRNNNGTWYHGDFIALTESQGSAGGIVVYGRSDATLNPGGVRIGTAEIYRLVETLDFVADSIVVGQPWEGDVRVVLFVRPAPGTDWTEDLSTEVKKTIRAGATPRHVPAVIHPVTDIPYTISGKKVELAVLRLLQGEEPKNTAALQNPGCLEDYRLFAARA